MSILLFLAGLLLVIFGSDYLVEGASGIARRSGLSEFVIGLTIVGMGTSAPEMVVSFIGAASGNADVAVGNVLGSNIFNTLLILGATALILPMEISRSNRLRDIPINLGITILLLGLGLWGKGLGLWDGAVLLLCFVAYMVYTFKNGENHHSEADGPQRALWLQILMVAGGIAALIVGGRLFVDNAVSLARSFGVSDKFIAITLLAGGTSLPELATCIAAAIKKKGQLALGNIIGSNIFNVLLILGGSALINPLSFADISPVDMAALLASALALLTACVVGRRNVLDRLDGVLFLLLWIAYMVYLSLHL
ncbi:MAG: calcium/sodium antiporter [Bacteroidales bacterium]|nr:calcium/sodium antiporter [Bacteroidales bacterium]